MANIKPLSKSELWMWGRIEARLMLRAAEKRAKAVLGYATTLARKRGCTVSQALRLIQEHASKED